MSLAAMIAQALVLFVEVLAVFSLIGYGVVALLLPDMEGYELLLMPAVGWAVAVIACQWFTTWVAPPVILGMLTGGFGLLSLTLLWCNRACLMAKLRAQRFALLLTLLGAVGVYLTQLIFVFHVRRFGFDGVGADAPWYYAQASAYLTHHTFPTFSTQPLARDGGPSDFSLQIILLLRNAFPAIGQLDAALAGITRWPVHAIIEPLGAFCIAFALLPLYALCAYGLSLSRRVTIAVIALFLTNQFNIWVLGMDFVQHLRAVMLVPTALCLVIAALRTGRRRIAGVAGITIAAMIGVYFPLFVVLLIAIAAYALVATAQRLPQRGALPALRQLGLIAGSGIVLAVPSFIALIGVSGWRTWLALVQSRTNAAGVSQFFPLPTMLAMSPLTGVLTTAPTAGYSPLLWPLRAWAVAGTIGAAIACIALAAGFLMLLVRKRLPECLMFAALLGYLLYLRVYAQYPYGFMRAVCYVVPFTSILIAVGAFFFASRRAPQPGGGPVAPQSSRGVNAMPRGRTALAVLGVGAMILAQVGASVEMERGLVRANAPLFPPEALELRTLASVIPVGKAVYVYHDGHPAEVYRSFEAAYFLPDRKVTIRSTFNSAAFDEQTAANGFAPYDYVLLPTAVALRLSGDVHLLWQNSDNDLLLYQRTGPQVCFLPFQPMVAQYIAQISDQAAQRGVPIREGATQDALTTLLTLFLEVSALQHAFATPTTLNVSALLSWSVSNNGFPQLADARPVLSTLVERLAPTPGITLPLHPPCPRAIA